MNVFGFKRDNFMNIHQLGTDEYAVTGWFEDFAKGNSMDGMEIYFLKNGAYDGYVYHSDGEYFEQQRNLIIKY